MLETIYTNLNSLIEGSGVDKIDFLRILRGTSYTRHITSHLRRIHVTDSFVIKSNLICNHSVTLFRNHPTCDVFFFATLSFLI